MRSFETFQKTRVLRRIARAKCERRSLASGSEIKREKPTNMSEDLREELQTLKDHFVEQRDSTTRGFDRLVLTNLMSAFDVVGGTINIVPSHKAYEKMPAVPADGSIPSPFTHPRQCPELSVEKEWNDLNAATKAYNERVTVIGEIEQRAVHAANIKVLQIVMDFGNRAVPNNDSTVYTIKPKPDLRASKKQRTKE